MDSLQHRLAELLDKVCQRLDGWHEVARRLPDLDAEWTGQGGSREGHSLIMRAQGTVGMIGASLGHATQELAVDDLLEFKRELRNAAAGR